MSTFELAIITPEGKLFEGMADYVNLPGSEGRFEVLAKHMNLVASLNPGVVEVSVNGAKSHFIVFDGIAQVDADSCSVLVEKGVSVKNINLEAAKEELSRLEYDLGVTESELMKAQIHKEIEYRKAMLEFNL